VPAFINVTGTPGNDNIKFKTLTAFGNNNLPDIGVNGFDTRISKFGNAYITANGLGGNDTISLVGLNSSFRGVYTKATLISGRGNSMLIAANSASDTVDHGGLDSPQLVQLDVEGASVVSRRNCGACKRASTVPAVVEDATIA
jgi:hypothetical protein